MRTGIGIGFGPAATVPRRTPIQPSPIQRKFRRLAGSSGHLLTRKLRRDSTVFPVDGGGEGGGLTVRCGYGKVEDQTGQGSAFGMPGHKASDRAQGLHIEYAP